MVATAAMVASMVAIIGFAVMPQAQERNLHSTQATIIRDIRPNHSGQLVHSGQQPQQDLRGSQQGTRDPQQCKQAQQVHQITRHQQVHTGLQRLLGILDLQDITRNHQDPLHSQDLQGLLCPQAHMGQQDITGATHMATTKRVNSTYKHRTLNGENLTIQMINVCGLRGKLDIPEFRDNLKVYDISLLCETKLDECDEDYILSFITPLKLKAFFKQRKTLTAWRSGGLCILYKESLDKYISYCNSSSKLVQWILISKVLTGSDKDVLIGNTYVPPEGTKYQSLTPFQDLQEDIQKFNNCYVCIAGDLNSHTNTIRDYVEVNDFMPEQLNFDIEAQNHLYNIQMLNSHNIRLSRSNMDQRRNNSHGIQLIEFCKSNNMFISNGRMNSDLSGKATTSDGSLIDYMLANPALLCKVENFLVHDFDAIFSDKHCKVSWSISCSTKRTVQTMLSM